MVQCSTAHIMHHGKCRDTDGNHVKKKLGSMLIKGVTYCLMAFII